MNKNIDITPTPRILRTLGDIPFGIWQCMAELADNSLDAFRECEKAGCKIEEPRLDIHWSKDSTPNANREIIVEDNGLGMTLEQLQNAARAGYSNNDPISNLGLFGMGFNIATARLGDETEFVSATKESSEWIGIRINFSELVKNQTFSAPIVRFPKNSLDEHGTRVVIRKLKEGVFGDLKKSERSIRRRLEIIYSPILERERVGFYLQGKQLHAQPHCVWGETRYVVRKHEKIFAVQNIDRDLGDTWFDLGRNRYLSEDEGAVYDIAESKAELIPGHIVRRARRLKGWIGIQRYADPSEFGIDFIRNGRKILVAEKSVFGYENPDSGAFISEYPVELGSTVGGRIVGELHVDYLIPTYQKNSFDTTDMSWRVTIEALRGAGPILPMKRKALGYDGDNRSPLAILANAYRRVDPGTKNLFLRSGVAKDLLKKYINKDPDYLPDDRWYLAAQDADRERGAPSTPVNPGVNQSDDPDLYGPTTDINPVSAPVLNPQPLSALTTTRDEIISHSERVESLCGEYAYGATPGIIVTARRTLEGNIRKEGSRLPFLVFQDGVEIDFFYDESHPLLAEYPLTPKQLLLQALAEKFSLRDHGVSIQKAFIGLVDNHMTDERINFEALKERAHSHLSTIRDDLPQLLKESTIEAFKIIHSDIGEKEKLAATLINEDPELLEDYLKGGERAAQALAYVSTTILIRLVEGMPDKFLDGIVFRQPYLSIDFGHEGEKRLRRMSLEKIVSYLKDVEALLQGGSATPTKSELIRYANTLTILEGRLA